ncbi:MAG: radical SAM protein [Deltaproteobacteria bacterium]|nr:radical SAM protein [bacterium]MCB9475851.1 radical SAM protein [Deltaproteobacteria bacterium]MCB9490008.1 radical SAM protein [Deltaproteobacteria bacterium]
MHEFSEFKVLNYWDRVGRVLKGELPPPVTLEMDPTNACNHDCVWCIDREHRSANAGFLKREVALSVIEQAAALGVKSIVLKGGGEPLVYPWIDELLYAAHGAGLAVGMITNGELVRDHVQAITECCTWLRLSVDAGSEATHKLVHKPVRDGAYERVWEGIKQVSDKVFCGMIYIIHPDTYHEMHEGARRAREAGCKYIAFKRVVAPGEVFTHEAYDEIEASYHAARKQYSNGVFQVMGLDMYNFIEGPTKKAYKVCKAHHLVAILCANGKMYACCSTRGRESHCFGSVYENTLEEIWYGDKRRRILQDIDDRKCAHICPGHTSFMRYDHYNKMFEYLMLDDKPHADFA